MPYTEKNKKREYQKEYAAMNRRVSITLSKKEYELLETKAKETGWKPGTLAREILLQRLSGSPIVPEGLEEELRTLNILVRNVANNVNQIARHSNQIKRLMDEKSLIGELAKLARLITGFVHDKAGKKDDN